MKTLQVDLTLSRIDIGEAEYSKTFEVEDSSTRKGWNYLSGYMFRECEMRILYRTYRKELPAFQGLSEPTEWTPSQSSAGDLIRWGAHVNTAETWFAIQNTFFEAAHLLAQSRAYQDIEIQEADEEQRFLVHIPKIQFFNSAVYLICKIQDLFLLLLFVNSGGSLNPSVDVHSEDWMKEIRRVAIYNGLKVRKSQSNVANTSPYLDALSDEEYSSIRNVFRKMEGGKPLRTIRKYRNAIAHKGLPAVDYAVFSPAYRFPKKEGTRISLRLGGRGPVEYKFLELYDNAVASIKHLETQLKRIKAIPVLKPS